MANAPPDAHRPSLLVRLGWLVAIWATGVLALGIVAWAIRQLMEWAGLKA